MRWRETLESELDISPAVGSIGCCYFLLGLNKLISEAILQPYCLYDWALALKFRKAYLGLPHVLVQPKHVDCVG